ncbi:hypothetical protein AZF37_06015 [endosymbiont 'TC1' of Trimyema compressum]|uniref:DnaD domain-containing protein n=1 Tax=endosymbiont 'TC1' of Trimyema compressum TaxID=243899 RepID=UPI0007F09355|nr:DnaD domain protein [endosymbiont 'TC1' of Trimyema compressum]AMP20790.1 hypothetical protein AZF37_06015 [endosymbiont 'TC1' of Trimyema compressum]
MINTYLEFLESMLGKGIVALPKVLFTKFRELNLTMDECFLLMELWYFKYGEDNESPAEDLLCKTMGIDEGQLFLLLSNVIQKGMVTHEENNGSISYSLTPLLEKLFELWSKEEKADKQHNIEEKKEVVADEAIISQGNMYQLFEGEFGRILSPIEIDNIQEWLHEKMYSESMIKEALTEAVLIGKLNFKYIDRILLDWEKKGVNSAYENEAVKKNKTEVKNKKTKKKSTNKSKYDDVYLN